MHLAAVKPQFLEDRTDEFRKTPEQAAADRLEDEADLAADAEADRLAAAA